jgi:hypothetical protein
MNTREASERRNGRQPSAHIIIVVLVIAHLAMLRRALLVVFVSQATNGDDACGIARVVFNF